MQPDLHWASRSLGEACLLFISCCIVFKDRNRKSFTLKINNLARKNPGSFSSSFFLMIDQMRVFRVGLRKRVGRGDLLSIYGPSLEDTTER